jgi:hypothetical protein
MTMPILITESIYDVTKSSGELLAAELIIRTHSLIIGLLVISTALHRYSQKGSILYIPILMYEDNQNKCYEKNMKKTSLLGKDVFFI